MLTLNIFKRQLKTFIFAQAFLFYFIILFFLAFPYY